MKILRDKGNRVKYITLFSLFLLLNLLSHILFPVIISVIKKQIIDISISKILFHFMELDYLRLFLKIEAIILLICFYVMINSTRSYTSNVIKVTDDICIPAPAGQGQFGSARFATKKEIKKYFGYEDFRIEDYDFSEVWEMNIKEDEELEKIKESDLYEDIDRVKLEEVFISSHNELKDEDIRGYLDYLKGRTDIKYILKSRLSMKDIKMKELEKIEFDEYYARLKREELLEVMIAIEKADSLVKKKKVEKYMVRKKYEKIEQLREIRYAIEDDIEEKELEKYADNRYSSGQMREIRLAYNDDKIMNKRLVFKYLIEKNISEEQMKKVRKALAINASEREIEEIINSDIIEKLKKDNQNSMAEKKDSAILYRYYKKEGGFERAGLVVGKENLKDGERIYQITDDVHSLIIGETGSGKTRSMVLQSIVSLALAEENMIITDIKGELSEFTENFLRAIGYKTIFIDFRNPLKSVRINFLQPVIDAMNEGDVDTAVEYTWDITMQLVGEVKGEPIWNNGEAAIIAGAIMSVIYDNRNRPEYQNFANVYNFLATMCKPVVIGEEMIMPINEYVQTLDLYHPAKRIFAIGEIAPSRTRGSFFTSALTTLRLFTSEKLSDMTRESEFNMNDLATKKIAVFIILPEDRNTYNEIASLYVGLQYQSLSKMADRIGGRLKIRCNYLLDEFGNFPAIPNFLQIITVARGKGVRLNLFLQDLSQLQKIYGKEGADTIYGNCGIWIYLRTSNKETLEMISSKLSQYTVSTYSLSSSTELNRNSSSSYSVQLSGRNLLNVNELGLFKRPYSLVMSGINPAIIEAEDFSKWQYVKLLNMGTKKKDTKLRYLRQKKRYERLPRRTEFWNIQEETIKKYIERSVY